MGENFKNVGKYNLNGFKSEGGLAVVTPPGEETDPIGQKRKKTPLAVIPLDSEGEIRVDIAKQETKSSAAVGAGVSTETPPSLAVSPQGETSDVLAEAGGEVVLPLAQRDTLFPKKIKDLSNEEETLGLDLELGIPLDMAQEIKKRYEVMEELGRGGMGVVFKARDRKMPTLDDPAGRIVAIKVMLPNKRGSKRSQRRFAIEAKGPARMNQHKNLTFVYDLGESKSGSWLVTEYAGISLEKVLKKKKTLLPDQSLQVVSGVAKGLMAMHRAGIIHKDIKPGNILLPNLESEKLSVGHPFEGAKLGDFGLLHIVDEPEMDKKYKKITEGLSKKNKPRPLAKYYEGLEREGGAVGTPQYMSPEAFRGFNLGLKGEKKAEMMRASDVYSLGVMFYEMLTGKYPFQGKNVKELYHNILKSKPISPHKINNDVPVEISRLIMAMLEKNYKKRPKTLIRKREESLLDKLAAIENKNTEKKSLLNKIRARWN